MPYFLVGDVGGTNARFLIYNHENTTVWQGKFVAEHYSAFEDAIAQALKDAGVDHVTAALFAVACPVDGDQISLTNNSPWTFSQQAVKNQFGFEHLWVINDFAAMAHSLPVIPPDELLHVGGPKEASRRCKIVVGPGTGLGVAGLLPTPVGWQVISTEGGHANFAPGDDEEIALMKSLWKKFQPVSREEILSGRGLLNLYHAMQDVHGGGESLTLPAQVTQSALEKREPLAVATLNKFCGILGSVAGDIALGMGSLGGVYITGGIVPRFPEFFAQSPFRQAFENKYRYQNYLAAIPTWLVQADEPGLLGAKAALAQLLQQHNH